MASDSTRSVLILDDDEYIRKFVVALLTNIGYTVTEARTGRDASYEMRKRRFDLVIVDYRLPDCDGLSWISLQRGAGCTTPFMFMSGTACDARM